ncbi:MAG: hypothetical protein ACR2QO_26730 [Acidimicrobiales bacterium]
MLVPITALVLGVALTIGLVANRWVRPFAETEVQGVKLELLVSPLLTLTVLLLSFVLVQAFGSYNRVRAAESEEAGKLVVEYRTAGYLPEEAALPIQTALVCYGRSVVHIEWPSLADGTDLHPIPTRWAQDVQPVLAELSFIGDTDQPYGALLTAEKDRAEGRRKRITEADPSVPQPVTILMLLVSAAALTAIATFTLPYVSRTVQIGALIVMAIVFLAMQWTIYEIDNKFDGVIQVEPTDMALLSGAMDAQFAEQHPEVSLPCDERGAPR